MPYFREEDKLRKSNNWSQEAHDVLVVAIQTIDKECRIEDKDPLWELRQRLDLILNSMHWKEKRSKEDNERLNWLATTGGHEE